MKGSAQVQDGQTQTLEDMCQFRRWETPSTLLPSAPPFELPHLLMLSLEQRDLLLHLTDVAGGLGHLGALQVALSQQLLDVLLLLLERLLQSGGARDLAGIARRCLGELQGTGSRGSGAEGCPPACPPSQRRGALGLRVRSDPFPKCPS